MIGSVGALPRCRQVRHTLPPSPSTFLGKRTASNRTGTGITRTLRHASLLRGHLAATTGISTASLQAQARPRSAAATAFPMIISDRELPTALIVMDRLAWALASVTRPGSRRLHLRL